MQSHNTKYADNQRLPFCYGPRVDRPSDIHPCTIADLTRLSTDPNVLKTCQELAKIEDNTDNKEKIRELKNQLPYFTFGAKEFNSGFRNDQNAVLSGFGMVDVDHLTDAKSYLNRWGDTKEEQIRQLKVCGVVGAHLSASGRGWHFIISLRPGEDHKQATQRVTSHLGIDQYDEGVAKPSRPSFAVPYFYWLFLDHDTLIQSLGQPFTTLPAVAKPQSVGQATAPDTSTSGLAPATDHKKDCYEGVPITLLITRIQSDVMELQAEPSAQDHNRHTNYLKLLSYARWFCDFDAESMYQNVPNWGLPEAECRTACRDACRMDHGHSMPRVLQMLLRKVKADMQEAAGVPTHQEAIQAPMPTSVPRLFGLLFKFFPRELRQQVFLASMMWLGALCTSLRRKVNDYEEEAPVFIIIVEGHSASGKGFTRYLNKILSKPMDQDDKAAEAYERHWGDLCAAAGSKDKPLKPHLVKRRLHPDFTQPALNDQIIDSRGQIIFIFSEESDNVTWTKTFSSTLRQGFDGVETGQSRVSATSVRGSGETHINFLACGTPRAIRRLFPDAEDGTIERAIRIHVPHRLGQPDYEYGHLSDSERQEIDDIVLSLHKIGLVEHPVITDEEGNAVVPSFEEAQPEHISTYVEMPRLEKRLRAWKTARNLEYGISGGKAVAMAVFARRVPRLVSRIGMVLYALEGMKETNRSIELCMWAADYILQNLLDSYGHDYEDQYEAHESAQRPYKRRTPNEELYDALPSPFSIQDMRDKQAELGIKVSLNATNVLASRWKSRGLTHTIEGQPGLWYKGPAPDAANT